MAWLTSHQPAIAIVLAALAFLGQFIQFTVTHSNDAKNRQFEAYHRLIKEWSNRKTALHMWTGNVLQYLSWCGSNDIEH